VHFTPQVHTMSSQDTRVKITRRKHSTAFKREVVERCIQPGASVSAIALESGVNANVVFRWRREHLRGTERAEPAPAGLVPVQVAPAAEPTVQEVVPPMASKPVGVIEIDIGDARVRLLGAVEEVNVRCVLRTLRGLG
jgi:transposase